MLLYKEGYTSTGTDRAKCRGSPAPTYCGPSAPRLGGGAEFPVPGAPGAQPVAGDPQLPPVPLSSHTLLADHLCWTPAWASGPGWARLGSSQVKEF